MSEEKKFLDATDYSIFIATLVIPVAIGLYFGFINKKKPNTTSEYLTGSKELSVFPISMSLFSSLVSGINFLAQPTEVYMYGSQITIMAVFIPLSVLVVVYTFVPVFCNLNILSTYEYLTKRFNYKIGMLGSVLFLIRTSFYSSIVIYVAVIALSQLSGFQIEILIPIFSVICVFYTSIGGLRAVVWTDTFQTFFMLIGAFALAFLGTYRAGGFKNVWERNEDSGRIEFFNLDPDPRRRTTFWTIITGYFFFVISENTVNQTVVQRCLALSTPRKIKITTWIFVLFIFTIVVVNGYNGLVAFATFYDCDPVTTKKVAKGDQIMPYLWMFLTRDIPALPGLFVSALFSASLSTISTNLNCMAGLFAIDIMKPLFNSRITEARATFLMKIMVIIFGGLLLGLAFVIDKMGGLFQVVVSFTGLVNGPLFGMFLLGMFCPSVGTKAVVIATLVSSSFITWIFVGSQISVDRSSVSANLKKNFSIEGCDNSTLDLYYNGLHQIVNNTTTNRTEPFPLYEISFHYYTLITTFVSVVVGLIASYLTGGNDRRRNPNLYSPIIRKFIKLEVEEEEQRNHTIKM